MKLIEHVFFFEIVEAAGDEGVNVGVGSAEAAGVGGFAGGPLFLGEGEFAAGEVAAEGVEGAGFEGGGGGVEVEVGREFAVGCVGAG